MRPKTVAFRDVWIVVGAIAPPESLARAPAAVACLEEKIHREVEEVKKGKKMGLSKRNFFYLFDFAVKISFKRSA
jgi:hypothetical protein